ncbi:MAG: ATP-binding protein [Cyanobacteria bacterium P01_A01_bin.84]
MKLRTKILAGYGVSLTLIVLVGLWGVINLWRLGRASEAILQDNYRSIRAAEGMLEALERQESATLSLLLDNKQANISTFKDNEIEFLQWLGRAKDNITIPGETEIVSRLKGRYKAYLTSTLQLIQKQNNQQNTTISFYNQSVVPEFKAVRQASVELRNLNQQTMISASQKAQITSQQAIASMLVAGASAAGVGLVFSLILSKNLTHPLNSITEAAGQIADGNYDVNLSSQSNGINLFRNTSGDELGTLAQEINTMSQKLKEFHALSLDKIVVEEQRNQAIINSIADGIVVVDDNFHIIAINPIAARLFNTTPNQVEGRHYLEMTEDRTLYNPIQALLQEKQQSKEESIETSENPLLSLEINGTEQHYRYLITPVTTEDKRRLGVVLLLQNITKFKKIDELKSDFVMTASHELRTPLTGMAMSIELLLETAKEKLSEREQELLHAAAEDVERLRSLVNDLLDLSKIESGRIDMERVPVEIDFIVDKVMSLFAVQGEEKGIELHKDIASNLPPVNADANKITWVLTNLVANALRYAETKIQIIAKQHANSVFLSVTDDGQGIEPAFQAKIFDKFVQVQTERDVGGSGLGLAICKEIVKAHGGTIWVDSTPGNGSTFNFTLPTIKSFSQSGEVTNV